LPLAAAPVVASLWTWTLWRRVRGTGLAVRVVASSSALVVLGLDAIVHVALTGRFGLYGGAFGRTCGWTLSQMTAPDVDCHYLYTVAAQGHPWLVRPLRMGVRRGRPIVVNRQLAVANAFEDLLRERSPRFARAVRAIYDRCALPVSRYLLHPLAADLVYLAMLPAQAVFELSLRWCDADPEARIDRMYAPAAAAPP
jgi:hypothetical protein